MTDKETEKPGGTKQLVTLIAAVTALVTALTSLVKAVDKRVEQASYETLSHKIVELQDSNTALHKEVENLKGSVLPVTPTVVPSSAPSGAPPSVYTGHLNYPSYTAIPVSAKEPVLAKEPKPGPPTPRPPLPPPPSWGDVKARAEKM